MNQLKILEKVNIPKCLKLIVKCFGGLQNIFLNKFVMGAFSFISKMFFLRFFKYLFLYPASSKINIFYISHVNNKTVVFIPIYCFLPNRLQENTLIFASIDVILLTHLKKV